MKIGILTLPLKGNYGGVLQAYALQTFLKKEGHDVFLIDRQWDVRKNKTWVYRIQKFVFHYIIRKNVMRFCEEWIQPKTKRIDNQEEMKTIDKEGFDAVVVGSDQVWRVEHTGGVKNNFFLDFISSNKTKKISYAASFGKDSVDVTKENSKKIAQLLKDFTAISVREKSGIKICSEVFDVNAIQVLDPTLLLLKEDYLPIIEKKHIKPLRGVLTTYVLDTAPEKMMIIDKVSTKLGLKVNSINYKKNPALLIKNKGIDIHNYIYPSVSNWLRGFRDADFIITDSFHGMLFSVIFKKQFIVIANERRGLARFESFLTTIGLQSRLISSKNKDYEKILENNIDYKLVDKILDDEKKYSKLFLLNSLNS